MTTSNIAVLRRALEKWEETWKFNAHARPIRGPQMDIHYDGRFMDHAPEFAALAKLYLDGA
jgi:hypothetical protein